jgi:hypothetical protein
MLANQHALQVESESSQPLNPTAVKIDLEDVSVSQLLGRDYLFINTQNVKLPLHNPALTHDLLNNLIQQLELTEAYTVVVTVEELNMEKPSFTRHDLRWHRHEICRIDSIAITHHDQYEFIEMIWRCSTSATSTLI